MQEMAERNPERNLGREPGSDFPLVVAGMPASARVQRTAFGLVIVLLLVFMLLAPFANVRLARIDAFIPVLQTVMCFADLVTAVLLFAQYSIQPRRALLALASGYICSGLFAFLQTLAFPGAYAPAGVLGGGPDTASWLFVLWHTTFPLAVLVYALSKDADDESRLSGRSIRLAVGLAVACTLAVTAGLTWVVTAGAAYLPELYVGGGVTQQAPLANQVNIFMGLLHATTLVVLFVRRRTILDIWLIVTLLAWMPNFVVAALMTYVRFSLGWYTARAYALIASCIVLGVLLAETTMLYARLAGAFVLLRRERAHRLMSVEAATSAMAHEIRQPLTGIAARGGSALNWLKRTPPDLQKVSDCLKSIVDAAHRADEIISSVRALFRKADSQRAMLYINDIARQALRLVGHDLTVHEVIVTEEYQGNVPQISADRSQLQQVILNLIRNAIDAMGVTSPRERRLRLVTRLDGGSTVVLSVEDSGPGITTEDRDRIFDPFFSTKPNGMGLGLAICRTIVEGHGGELRLAKSDSHGTIFEIALPFDSNKSVAQRGF